jgi:methyl-accepting chemotaxis protein
VLWASGISTIALGGVTQDIWFGAWRSGLLIPLAALAVAFAGFVGTAFFAFIVSPIVGNRLRELAVVAEAVAAGDLTLRPAEKDQGGEIGRLARAMEAMTSELSRLASVIRSSTGETTTFAGEITGGTEHLAQAASAIALTASTLSHQAVQMADTISALNSDTGRLGDVVRTIASGARDGQERNRHLKALASDNHMRLEESFNRLGALSDDVQASAQAVEALGAASGEIGAFVTLVQKIARQSKLLALNAAMEAARAGEQGEGFAVVATEVRRLAASTAGAAEQTESLIQGILARLDDARSASVRALDRVRNVKEATEHGRRSFTQVEAAVKEADQWTEAMASSAISGDALVGELQHRLSMLNTGTQSFVNAMHDVAAASEEQSASTEEIAAAAGQLSHTAERLDQATSVFKTA